MRREKTVTGRQNEKEKAPRCKIRVVLLLLFVIQQSVWYV